MAKEHIGGPPFTPEQLWSQLENAVALVAKEDQVAWTIFGIFWAAEIILLGAVFENGDLPDRTIGPILAGAGVVMSIVWALIQSRVLRFLQFYERVMHGLEAELLKGRAEFALSKALNVTVFSTASGTDISARLLMIGSSALCTLFWFAVLIWLLCFCRGFVHLSAAADRERWASLMRVLAVSVSCLLVTVAHGQPAASCDGTPKDAVMTLPAPLDRWGVIECTPYGHIIASKDGWLWTYPGGFEPVFIPSQMVRSQPAELGNASYFSSISVVPVTGAEFDVAYKAFSKGFDEADHTPLGYRLEVKSISGKSLRLYFFDSEDSAPWGIWCTKECDPDSRFMILNMSEPRPSS
jgi:hypothetical protein